MNEHIFNCIFYHINTHMCEYKRVGWNQIVLHVYFLQDSCLNIYVRHLEVRILIGSVLKYIGKQMPFYPKNLFDKYVNLTIESCNMKELDKSNA